MEPIGRDELRRLVAEEAAQVVEVLPEEEYEEEHIPGALHIPLTELSEEQAGALDRARPVIVYCNDFL